MAGDSPVGTENSRVVVVAAPAVTETEPDASQVGPAEDELLKLEGHNSAVTGLAWHPKSAVLASGSSDGTALLWDVAAANVSACACLKGHKASLTALSFVGSDGDAIATASADKTIGVYDAITAERVRTFRGHSSHVTSVDAGATLLDRAGVDDEERSIFDMHARPKYVLVSGSNDRTARVWDSRSRRAGAEVVLKHAYQVLDVAWGMETWSMYTGGIDPRVHVWDTRKPDRPTSFLEAHGEMVTGLAPSPMGTHMASRGADGRVGVWDIRAFVGKDGQGNRLERALDCGDPGFESNLLRLCWDRCGTRIAAGTADGAVLVWDADDGELLWRLPGHSASVNDVAFSLQNDTLIASGSSDGCILLGHLPRLLT